LADDGVRVTGLDLSEQQLAAAHRTMRATYPLVQAAAEEVPFVDASFDLVFCDHGAMSWGDPYRTVPEVSRILRSGGRLVFSASSPWVSVCYEDETDLIGTTLQRSYFDLYRQPEGDGASTYALPYGEWIRLFRRNGFEVEDLIEVRPNEQAETSYHALDPSDWAHRWPSDCLWVARRA
jgi:ubiquinone/menaquinone biosynthesis C-methylase UbiE